MTCWNRISEWIGTKEKSSINHRFSHWNMGIPVSFPLNQSSSVLKDWLHHVLPATMAQRAIYMDPKWDFRKRYIYIYSILYTVYYIYIYIVHVIYCNLLIFDVVSIILLFHDFMSKISPPKKVWKLPLDWSEADGLRSTYGNGEHYATALLTIQCILYYNSIILHYILYYIILYHII